ncbi:MAG: hypothetical protein ACR2F6_03105 [Mycobacteriales bacterium]
MNRSFAHSPARGTVRRRGRGAALAAVGAAVALLSAAIHPAGASPKAAPATYHNPVSQGYSIDFPDPTILRGKGSRQNNLGFMV